MRLLVDCSGQKLHNEGGRTVVEYFLAHWSEQYGPELLPVFSSGEVPPDVDRVIGTRELAATFRRPAARRLWDLHVAVPRAIRALAPDAAYFPNNVLPVNLPEGLPTVVALQSTIHYHYPAQSSLWRNAYLRAATVHAVRRAKRVIVPSSSTADDLMRHAFARRERIVVIPYGVDCARFFPGAPQEVEPKTFLFVSRPYDYKGLLTAFRAMRCVASVLGADGLRLLVVDGGVPADRHASLVRAAEELGVRPNVSLLGRVDHDQLAGLYRKAAALVLPTSCESFGHPFVEAAASGCPVITGSGHGIDATIGPVARLVAEHDHRSIAQEMVVVSQLSDDERHLAALELRRWAENFSWETTVAETREVIAELIR
jgi:glycosyltransferase involved in cell wall biosynthesis